MQAACSRQVLTCLLLLIIAAAAVVNCQKYAVITLQRDETEMLRDWILHHGGIFGYENLYIIDQQSQSPLAKRWLKIAEDSGVNVIWFEGEFRERSAVVTETMHDILEANPDVEIIIPLDADEFIVAQNTSAIGVYGPEAEVTPSYTADPELVLATLDALPRDGFKYKFNEVMAVDCPSAERRLLGQDLALEEEDSTREETRALGEQAETESTHIDLAVMLDAPVADLVPKRRVAQAQRFVQTGFTKGRKTFFYRDGFISTDGGNHRGRVRKDEECEGGLSEADRGKVDVLEGHCFHRTTLAIVHYGIRAISFASWKAKTVRGAKAHGYDENTDCGKVNASAMYCRHYQMIQRDEEEAFEWWERRACNGVEWTVSSDFVVRAADGDYSGSLDFPHDAPKLRPK